MDKSCILFLIDHKIQILSKQDMRLNAENLTVFSNFLKAVTLRDCPWGRKFLKVLCGIIILEALLAREQITVLLKSKINPPGTMCSCVCAQ